MHVNTWSYNCAMVGFSKHFYCFNVVLYIEKSKERAVAYKQAPTELHVTVFFEGEGAWQ